MARVKVKNEKLEEQPQQPQFPDTLSSSHLLALETLSRDMEMCKLRVSVEEQSLRNLVLELQLLSNKIDKQKLAVNNKAQEYEALKRKFQNYKKELWPQYGFSENDGLGYDPVTGKIVK